MLQLGPVCAILTRSSGNLSGGIPNGVSCLSCDVPDL